MSLETDILKNPFIEILRVELRIDNNAFDLLCDQLRQLAAVWRGQQMIDKRLAQELYAIPTVVKSASDILRENRPQMADELITMAIELDGLILSALHEPDVRR